MNKLQKRNKMENLFFFIVIQIATCFLIFFGGFSYYNINCGIHSGC